jgi:transposase-like protein
MVASIGDEQQFACASWCSEDAYPMDRWTAEERAEWVRLPGQIGQGLSEFCRESDLAESTVSLWRKQRPSKPRFRRAAVAASHGDSG